MNLNTCTYIVQPKTRTLKTRTLYSLRKTNRPSNSKLKIYLRHYFKLFLKNLCSYFEKSANFNIGIYSFYLQFIQTICQVINFKMLRILFFKLSMLSFYTPIRYTLPLWFLSQKLILFRNPKDVCVSYFHFYRSSSSFGNFRGSWAEFLEMFLDGHGMYVVFCRTVFL